MAGAPGGIRESFDITGIKSAYIFSWGIQEEESEDPNMKDANLVADTIVELGFIINHHTSSKTRVIRNLSVIDFISTIKHIASAATQDSCVFLYFIARQRNSNLVDGNDIPLSLFSIWEEFRDIECPKLFFIQANVNDTSDSQSLLLNAAAKPGGADPSEYYLSSRNTLLAYLPYGGGATKSVAELLREELLKHVDVNDVLTGVISKIHKSDPQMNPKFGSTFHKLLQLRGRSDIANRRQLTSYSISKKRSRLAYTFLFEEFEDKFGLVPLPSVDAKNFSEVFTKWNFTSEIKHGRITYSDFTKKIKSIVQEKEKMASCDCIMIIISSHGLENGAIYASDEIFTRDDVWTTLANCAELNGKPKVIIIDACRGPDYENPTWCVKNNMKKKRGKEVYGRRLVMQDRGVGMSAIMSDVLIVTSSTEGMRSYQLRNKSDDTKLDQPEHPWSSVFLNLLGNTIMKHGTSHSILTLLNVAMRQANEIEIKDMGDNKCSQQATFTSTLGKILKFR